MTGYIISGFPKQTVNFGVGTGPQEFVLADQVDILHWREATLQVWVHSHTLAAHGNTIQISVFGQSVSEDDPGLQFVYRSEMAQATIDQNSGSPSFFTLDIGQSGSMYFAPPMVRVVAAFTLNDSGTIMATLSGNVSVKER
jgi:hypothetical protein